jgi:hypothetical protein
MRSKATVYIVAGNNPGLKDCFAEPLIIYSIESVVGNTARVALIEDVNVISIGS